MGIIGYSCSHCLTTPKSTILQTNSAGTLFVLMYPPGKIRLSDKGDEVGLESGPILARRHAIPKFIFEAYLVRFDI